jgi:hypothetical protein
MSADHRGVRRGWIDLVRMLKRSRAYCGLPRIWKESRRALRRRKDHRNLGVYFLRRTAPAGGLGHGTTPWCLHPSADRGLADGAHEIRSFEWKWARTDVVVEAESEAGGRWKEDNGMRTESRRRRDLRLAGGSFSMSQGSRPHICYGTSGRSSTPTIKRRIEPREGNYNLKSEGERVVAVG